MVCAFAARAQQAVTLREAKAATQGVAQRFAFASDGPVGPGWTRPDAIARVYFAGELPALFSRTIRLDGDVPERTKLSWSSADRHLGLHLFRSGQSRQENLIDVTTHVKAILRRSENDDRRRPWAYMS